jgi:hypothetical protein
MIGAFPPCAKTGRMRFLVASLALAAIAAVPIGASAQPVALAGKMAPFSYLLGTPWSCTTSVPAMGNMPARTDRGTAAFEVAPGNVVHGHVTTPTYSGDFYYGFDSRTSMYWQASADNMGGREYLTSSDGKGYAGSGSMGAATAQETVTYGRSAAGISVHEVVSGPMGGTFDTTCTR